MNASQRVLAACQFQEPDQIPRFDSFWEYPRDWEETFGPVENLSDIAIWVPNETTFPTRANLIKEENGIIYEIEDWGRLIRRRKDAYFSEVLQVPIPPGCDPEKVVFDSPNLDSRFLMGKSNLEDTDRLLQRTRQQQCVFGKTGGPFLRSTFVRGEAQFLIDMAADPVLARVIAEKVTDHLIAIGLQEISRWNLQDTGIWIYDDMAANQGPMFSPRSFEKILLPSYRKMIHAYKQAGAKYVFLHSDGNINLLMDMLVDAGINGINPLERRAGMDPFQLRKRYPELILTGGMDNTGTLIRGPEERIRQEAKELIDLGRDGGLVIGTHSISPEIPLQHFKAYHDFVQTYGNFSM